MAGSTGSKTSSSVIFSEMKQESGLGKGWEMMDSPASPDPWMLTDKERRFEDRDEKAARMRKDTNGKSVIHGWLLSVRCITFDLDDTEKTTGMDENKGDTLKILECYKAKSELTCVNRYK